MENKTVSPYTIEKALVVSSQPQKTFKVVVVGDSNVGKTSLTFRFCEGKFINNTEATIGVDFREKVLDIDGEKIKLHLWDTAGQERFRNSITAHFYRNVHAFIVMYDVTNRASFDSVESWIKECKKYCFSDIPRILIGNKCDGHHAVTTYEAQQLADKHNMPLFETSAKLDSEDGNIEAIFLTLAYKLKNQKLLIPQPINVTAIEASKNLPYNSNDSSCC